MSDRKISPSSAGTGSGDLSPFTQVGGTPSSGLSEVFLKMAHNTPEEAAASLRSATLGWTLTSEWDLEEEEVVQLWLVEAEGKVCGGPVGLMSEGRFCVERALKDTGACGKAKVHLTKKHKGLVAGWYIGAGRGRAAVLSSSQGWTSRKCLSKRGGCSWTARSPCGPRGRSGWLFSS